jgi:hypothetical protein
MITEKETPAAPTTPEGKRAWVEAYLVKLQADLVKSGIMSQEEADAATAKAMSVYSKGRPMKESFMSEDQLRKLAGLPIATEKKILIERNEEPKTLDSLILSIAKKYFDIETLKISNIDQKDFQEVSVGSMKSALEAAYDAGYKDGSNQSPKGK